MKKVTTLTGHSYRVLYLAMSPDSETIVTGAADETLRFWKVFPKKQDVPVYKLNTAQDSKTAKRTTSLGITGCQIR